MFSILNVAHEISRNRYVKLRSLTGILGLLGLVGLTSAPAHAQFVQAYWAGDGNLLDSSGNGLTLTGVGSPTYAAGLNQQAFSLNGSSYLTTVSPTSTLVNTSFAVSAWVNFSALNFSSAGNLPNTIIAQDNGGGTTEKFVFYYDAASHSLGVHENGVHGSYFGEVSLSTPITTGTWNMLTVSADELADTLSFYENSTLVGTLSGMPWSDPTAGITIGAAEGIGFSTGLIQDVGIYYAGFTGAEVGNLYDTPPGPTPPHPWIGGSSTPEPGQFALLIGISATAVATIRRRRRV